MRIRRWIANHRLVDDLVAGLDENGQPYSDAMILSGIAGAYFAGMDTVAATMSFMLYAVLKTPGLRDRLVAEVDAVWESNSGLTPAALRKMDVLHSTALETLRLYPIAPFTPRTSMKDFEFEGHFVPAGTEVYVANALTHLLPEYYPNPEVFDVDRYARPDRPNAATRPPLLLGRAHLPRRRRGRSANHDTHRHAAAHGKHDLGAARRRDDLREPAAKSRSRLRIPVRGAAQAAVMVFRRGKAHW